jgi:hypothetical protein
MRKNRSIMVQGYDRVSTLDKGQQGVSSSLMQLIMQLLQGGGGNIQQNPLYQSGASYIQNLLSGSPESTAAFEAPHLRQFNEQTVPMLAERFSGQGAGAQRSSAFQQALGSAGAGLQENLAALRAGLQGQAANQALTYAQQPISNLSGLASLGLGTQTQALLPKEIPFWQQLLLGGAQKGSALASQYGSKLLGF